MQFESRSAPYWRAPNWHVVSTSSKLPWDTRRLGGRLYERTLSPLTALKAHAAVNCPAHRWWPGRHRRQPMVGGERPKREMPSPHARG
jgi:hypothetical protein